MRRASCRAGQQTSPKISLSISASGSLVVVYFLPLAHSNEYCAVCCCFFLESPDRWLKIVFSGIQLASTHIHTQIHLDFAIEFWSVF